MRPREESAVLKFLSMRVRREVCGTGGHYVPPVPHWLQDGGAGAPPSYRSLRRRSLAAHLELEPVEAAEGRS